MAARLRLDDDVLEGTVAFDLLSSLNHSIYHTADIRKALLRISSVADCGLRAFSVLRLVGSD